MYGAGLVYNECTGLSLCLYVCVCLLDLGEKTLIKCFLYLHNTWKKKSLIHTKKGEIILPKIKLCLLVVCALTLVAWNENCYMHRFCKPPAEMWKYHWC